MHATQQSLPPSWHGRSGRRQRGGRGEAGVSHVSSDKGRRGWGCGGAAEANGQEQARGRIDWPRWAHAHARLAGTWNPMPPWHRAPPRLASLPPRTPPEEDPGAVAPTGVRPAGRGSECARTWAGCGIRARPAARFVASCGGRRPGATDYCGSTTGLRRRSVSSCRRSIQPAARSLAQEKQQEQTDGWMGSWAVSSSSVTRPSLISAQPSATIDRDPEPAGRELPTVAREGNSPCTVQRAPAPPNRVVLCASCHAMHG
jgi:hypothetical protein